MGSVGGGGAISSEASGAFTTTTREPARIGTRGTTGAHRTVAVCPRRPSPAPSCSSTMGRCASRSCFSSTATISPTEPSSRCPRSSPRAKAFRRTHCSASRTCSSSCSRTTGPRAWRSPGTRAPCIATRSPRPTRSTGGRCPTFCGEQFPHFRPIVEAFGYRNLEFEGWEADDVIATLATRADAAGVKTTVVSTDRDAFQLVSENVCLMMTPRGVSDVHVYTPERVEARYGIRPDQIPDFIGLKGDTSDNIPGIPGIGDKTAGQLIAQYGSVEDVIEHADELTPARAKAIRERGEQARQSKLLATMRRDLELDFDPGEIVLTPPDRSQLREMFRRFEFRDAAQPRGRAGRGVARRRGGGRRRAGGLARRRDLGAFRPCGLRRGRRPRCARDGAGRRGRRRAHEARGRARRPRRQGAAGRRPPRTRCSPPT